MEGLEAILMNPGKPGVDYVLRYSRKNQNQTLLSEWPASTDCAIKRHRFKARISINHFCPEDSEFMRNLLMVSAAVLLVTNLACPTVSRAEQEGLAEESHTQQGVPDEQRIVADLTGHFVVGSESSSEFRGITPLSNVQNGLIRSSTRKGDQLEFRVTLILTADNENKRNLAQVDSLVIYRQLEGAWELLSVATGSVRDTGGFDLTMQNYLQDGC
jgi:hypothetical protein